MGKKTGTAAESTPPDPPVITNEDRVRIRHMFEVWRRARTTYNSLQKTIAKYAESSPKKADGLRPYFNELESVLAEVAKQGKGLRKIEMAHRSLDKVGVGIFVRRCERMLRVQRSTNREAKAHVQAHPVWVLDQIIGIMKGTPEEFIEIYCSDAVQGALYAEGPKRAAINAAARMLGKTPRTIYRMLAEDLCEKHANDPKRKRKARRSDDT